MVARCRANASDSWTSSPPVLGSFRSGAVSPTSSIVESKCKEAAPGTWSGQIQPGPVRRTGRRSGRGSAVVRPAGQQAHGVAEDGHDGRERLGGAAHAARQAHDQRPAPDARQGARQRRHRRGAQALGAHELPEARHLALDDRAHGLGGDVARGQAGAPGGDHELAAVRRRDQEGGDPVPVVRHHLDCRDLEARGEQQLAHGGPALVGHEAGRGAVADGQDLSQQRSATPKVRGGQRERKHGLRPACESVFPLPPTPQKAPKGCAEGAPNIPDRSGGVPEGGACPPLARPSSLCRQHHRKPRRDAPKAPPTSQTDRGVPEGGPAPPCTSVFPLPPTPQKAPKGCAKGAPNIPDRPGGVPEGGARPPLHRHRRQSPDRPPLLARSRTRSSITPRSTPLTMSTSVRPATAAAVRASISTPVCPVTRAVASIRTPSSATSRATSTELSGSGWHRGIRSGVRLAAMIPATRATPRASPLASVASRRARTVSGAILTKHSAVASRRVSRFSPTSTIRAAPASSTCVRRVLVTGPRIGGAG